MCKSSFSPIGSLTQVAEAADISLFRGPFSTDEDVIGRAEKWNVGELAPIFAQVNLFEMMLQKRQMVGGGKDVIRREPRRPKRPCEPAVLAKSLGGIFSRDVKIDDADVAAGPQDTFCVLDGREPVGDHG